MSAAPSPRRTRAACRRRRAARRCPRRAGTSSSPAARLELALETLRAGADPRELGRRARRAELGRRLAPAAVVAAQHAVAVEHERDVAVLAPERRAAGAAVQRGRDTAAVQEQDRLLAALDDALERLEQRRRERIARLSPQVDDAHRRQPPGDAPAELDPLEPLPALGPRRRAAENGDGAFERRPLRRDGTRVVARVRLLLVRRSCSSSTQIRPSPRTGAKIAERAPTAMRASPRASRCRSSRRSASVSAE